MRHDEPVLRLFVAVYPPAAVVTAMQAAADGLAFPPASTPRRVPDEQVHLTLQFIGPAARHTLRDVEESIAKALSGLPAFDLQPTRLISLPERGPARLVAAETTSPSPLIEAHHRLASRLARNPKEKGREKFLPHITLRRFTPPAEFAADSPLSIAPFRVDHVLLMKSKLSQAGAVHREIARFALTPPEA